MYADYYPPGAYDAMIQMEAREAAAELAFQDATDDFITEAKQAIADQTLMSDDTDAEQAILENLDEEDVKKLIRNIVLASIGRCTPKQANDCNALIIDRAMQAAAKTHVEWLVESGKLNLLDGEDF